MSDVIQKSPLESIGWSFVRIGDLCESQIESVRPEEHPEDEFIYVDISAVDASSKEIVTPKRLRGCQASSRARLRLKTGDVLVSTVRPNLNTVAMVGAGLDGAVGSTGFCVLRPKNDLDAEFLFGWVRSREFVDNLSALVAGAMYPAVSDGQVRAQKIPLPSISEQRRIAHLLRDQFHEVDRIRRMLADQLEAVNSYPAALLREAFAGRL